MNNWYRNWNRNRNSIEHDDADSQRIMMVQVVEFEGKQTTTLSLASKQAVT